MKVSKNFWLSEFIDPLFFEFPGIDPLWFIDKRIFLMAQFLRDRFGKPVTINNWASGGDYTLSGLRPFNTEIGAPLSSHKYGRAIDPKVHGVEAPEIQQDIIKNYHLYKHTGLTTIEVGTPTWTHMDCRQTNTDKLFQIIINQSTS